LPFSHLARLFLLRKRKLAPDWHRTFSLYHAN
jgi:hypothetical protein